MADMKAIKLTQGKCAIVDDADYGWLCRWRWCALRRGRRFYAVRMSRHSSGRQVKIYMHRQILGLVPGDGKHGDHINGDELDNRRCNLRACTNQENRWNQRAQLGTSSRFKGVSWHKPTKKWQAKVKHNRRIIYLGCFVNEVDAARVYDSKAKDLFGEFARLNLSERREKIEHDSQAAGLSS